jgi:hypothetical protein
MGFNATFNNISIISWRSVLLVTKTEVPRERESIRDATAELQVIIIWSCFINKQENKE